MKYLRLRDPSHAPRDGFEYFDPETKQKTPSRGKTLVALIETATLHRQANGLTIPDQFPWIVEHFICANFPPDRSCNRDGSDRDTSCAYRGEEVRRVLCESCGGSVKGVVLACTLHGECTLFSKGIGVRQCLTCPDQTPKGIDFEGVEA